MANKCKWIVVNSDNNNEVHFEENGVYYFYNEEKIYPRDIHKLNDQFYILYQNRVLSNQIYINGIIKVDQDEEKFEFVIDIVDDTSK